MASDEVIFLRDQVQRLNAELRQYQETYPPIHPARQPTGDETPWLTDKNLLSPLLIEYDSNLQVLRDQVEQYQQERINLKSQIDQLIAENQRLTRELKEIVQSQLEKFDIEDFEPDLQDDQLFQSLQEQLQLALQEKESIREMWQTAQQEIDRLEQQFQDQQYNARHKMLEQQANQIKNQYTSTVSELNNEINQLQQELTKTRGELRASNIQVADLRRTLEEMKKHYLRKEQENSEVISDGQIKISKLEEIERDMEDLQNRLEDTRKHNNHLANEKRSLEEKVIELQKKQAQLESKEYEAMLQVRESVQMVESAVLEKDQALVRERQAMDQIEKLQNAIGKLVDEAGARTREEVDNVKKQCNASMNRLMEEMHTLELDRTEKEAQLARAMREKRAAESELEKLYQEGLVKGSKDSVAYEDLNRRCCDAETARDEALTKLEALQASMKRSEMKWSQEKSQLASEVEQLKDRLGYLNGEFENVSESRVKLLEEVDELKRKVHSIKHERDTSLRNFNKQIAFLERDMKMKREEFEVKLQTTEDGHRHAMMEVRQMLNAQQRMSAKWKEECQAITQKFENKVSELRGELARYKKQTEELTKLLKESRDKSIEVEQKFNEYSRNIRRMEDRVRDAENRANLAVADVSQRMADKRNALFSVAARPNQHMVTSPRASHGMTTSPRAIPDPLALSDLGPPQPPSAPEGS